MRFVNFEDHFRGRNLTLWLHITYPNTVSVIVRWNNGEILPDLELFP